MASRIAVILAVSVGLAVLSDPATALQTDFRTLSVSIGGRSHALETQIVAPDGVGPFPLALVMHGSPRRAARRRTMTPMQLEHVAREFAERGYFAAIVMRRGYGQSTGSWSEGYGGCSVGNYRRGGDATAAEMRAALDALADDPRVDRDRVVAVGQSAGGFGGLALAATRPPGVRAVINLAGGRGSRNDGSVCSEDRLVAAFADYGALSRIPTLWAYARNDRLFEPRLATRFFRAFTASGGQAELLRLPDLQPNGHQLTSRAGIDLWRIGADAFLREVGLPTWEEPPERHWTWPSPPSRLSENGRLHWRRYHEAPGHKAFALSRTNSRFGWRSARRSAEEAKRGALEGCRRDDCEVIAVDGRQSAKR